MNKTQWHLDEDEVETILGALDTFYQHALNGVVTPLNAEQIDDLRTRIAQASDIIVEVCND